MKFSIIIPAHNEALYIGTCLASIQKAAEPFSEQVETIVVLNRCTDQTEEITRSYGVRVTCDDSKNLARIRNHGARIFTHRRANSIALATGTW